MGSSANPSLKTSSSATIDAGSPDVGLASPGSAAHQTGMNQSRIPPGVPAGGQFAASVSREVELKLRSPLRVIYPGSRPFPGLSAGQITEGLFVRVERERDVDVLIGPYPDKGWAGWALEYSVHVEGLVEGDCMDCYTWSGDVPDDVEVLEPDAAEEIRARLTEGDPLHDRVEVQVGDMTIVRSRVDASRSGDAERVRFEIHDPGGTSTVFMAHGEDRGIGDDVDDVAERVAIEVLEQAQARAD